MGKEHNVFIFAPNHSGSTVLMKLLQTIPNVVGQRWEGQFYGRRFMPAPLDYGLHNIWTEKIELFRDSDRYNWPNIKNAWMDEWSRSPKYNRLKTSNSDMFLLEKSPRHLMLLDMLQKEFPNSFYIIMVRNPYAIVEGVIRRKEQSDIDRIATHVGEVFRLQIGNIKKLKNNQINFTYEQLCSNYEVVKTKILGCKYPELANGDIEGKFAVHSYKGKIKGNVEDYNEKQLKNLSSVQISKINEVFMKYVDELSYFGYGFI